MSETPSPLPRQTSWHGRRPPKEDHIVVALIGERERLRDAIGGSLNALNNLRGYRVAEQRAFLAHVESIERQLMAALEEGPSVVDD